MAKVHESYDAGQVPTGSLVHFSIAGTIDMKHLVETISTRATVVILGAGGERVAVENNGAWDAAITTGPPIEAPLGAGYTVTDFTY